MQQRLVHRRTLFGQHQLRPCARSLPATNPSVSFSAHILQEISLTTSRQTGGAL